MFPSQHKGTWNEVQIGRNDVVQGQEYPYSKTKYHRSVRLEDYDIGFSIEKKIIY